MALTNVTLNTAPVTTEELLSKTTKKATLSPEDDTVFIEKNTSQLGYERTWNNEARFNIESNGYMNTITVQVDPYGMRADTAYIYLVYEITLKGNKDDMPSISNMFPFVAMNTLRFRLGQNQAEVISPNEHYMYKFMNILNSNFSTTDKVNILTLLKCFPHFDMSQQYFRKMMNLASGFDQLVSSTDVKEFTRKVAFVVPLTILLDMFNHKTILPVGTKFEITFGVGQEDRCQKNGIVNGTAVDRTGSYKFLPQESYLYYQTPERDPGIQQAKAENREYISEGLNYDTYRIEIPSGSTYYNFQVIRPGSKLPVKIDFGFIDPDILNSNKDIFQFKGNSLKQVKVNYNGPFPHQHTLTCNSSDGMKDWAIGGTNPDGTLDRLLMYQEFYNQTDTLLLDKFGESYNNEMTLPPMKRIHPFMAYLQEYPNVIWTDDMLKSLVDTFNNRCVYTMILIPSKMFDGSAYPTVEGSLEIGLTFAKPTEKTLILFMNCYYYQQTTLAQDGTCTITNITLDNFTSARNVDVGPSISSSDQMISDNLPYGEDANVTE